MRHAIGIDIGGTKTLLGIIGDDRRIIAQTRLPTLPQDGFDIAVRRFSDAIRDLLTQTKLALADLAGIGIGCPGPLNPFTGVINNDYTLPSWGGCNIVQAMAARFQVPVRLENDADVALLGEAFAGAGAGASHLVMLTFGTGVGGAVLNDGVIYRGANGEHPEIGHVPIDPGGPGCYCGLAGCLESLASGTAIADAGQRAGFADAQQVFAAAASRDGRARRILDRSVRAAATGLWTIIHTFLPERLILGGGIMDEHYDLFEPALREVIARAKLGPSTGMQLCKAQLQNDAGLVGAGFLALNSSSIK